jgi:integrase
MQNRGSWWEGQVSLGLDERGRRIRETVTAPTAEACAAKMAALQVERKINPPARKRRDGVTSMSDFFKAWIEDSQPPAKSERTVEYYQRVIKIVEPHIGRTPLKKFTVEHYRRLMRQLKSATPSTRHKVHMVLRAAFTHAKRDGLIPSHPLADVSAPKYEAKETRPFTLDEAKIFLKAIEGDELEALYWIAIVSGLREGELFDLRWRDLDLKQRVGSVRAKAKTRSSQATFDIPERVVGLLKPGKPDERVFPSQAGTRRVCQNFLRRDWYPLLAKIKADLQKIDPEADFPRIRFHDLRHTMATLLFAAGTHPKVVQERLRHSTIKTTLDTYSSSIPSMQRDTTELFTLLLATPPPEKH